MSDTYSVREFCGAVQAAVETTFPDEVWIKGAISGLSRSPNGHVYFDLIDPENDLGAATGGLVPVALFAKSKFRVNAILRKSGNVRMTDGVEIRVRGQVAYYPPQGRIQLIMSLIDPAYTMGQMAMARQALLEKLIAEGLLHTNRAHAMPALPLKIGLVTSDGSAAHADFAHELSTSRYRFEVVLFDSRVQGTDAVPSLVDGIEQADLAAVDVIVVVRGGGARSDLSAFDNERVARAVAGCGRPVVVGVGHEVDRSVIDELAHTSAKTPTAAAAVLVEQVRSFETTVEAAADRLVGAVNDRLDDEAATLSTAARRLTVAGSSAVLRHDGRLDRLATEIVHRARRNSERADNHLEQADVRLRALDPAAVLARGWSITHTADGVLIRSPDQVVVGSTVVTTTGSGKLTSTVVAAETTEPPSDEPNSESSEDR